MKTTETPKHGKEPLVIVDFFSVPVSRFSGMVKFKMMLKLNIKYQMVFYFLFLIFNIANIYGERLKLTRSQRLPTNEEKQGIEKLIKRNAKYWPLFTKFRRSQELLLRMRMNALQGRVDTVRVLALRVEFQEDSDTLTTGNGKMDLKGFLSPADGLLYDPPHTKLYFERQLQHLRNYYRLNSLGNLEILYRVMPDRFLECYQLPHNMKYYGDTTSLEGLETGLCRLMRDAIKIADLDPDLIFADYDVLIIFHAGSDLQSDWIKGNSPFDIASATIPSGALELYLGEPYILADEGRTRIYQAAILPEMTRQDTLIDGETVILGMSGLFGTLIHEFGHLLGAYDLYDVTGASMGVGSWSLMGTGGLLGDWSAGSPPGTIPGNIDAFHKVYLGWIKPLEVQIPKERIPVFCASMDSLGFSKISDSLPTIIKVSISQTEYFLIENRITDVKRKDTIVVDVEDGVVIYVEDGEYDFFQPGSGILIWHIDEKVIEDFGPFNAVNIDPAHKGIDLEEGDGIQDFDGWSGKSSFDYQIYGSKFDPYFLSGFNNEFSPYTNPNSYSYYGKTDIRVLVNNEPDTIMRIDVKFDRYQPGFPKVVSKNRFLSATLADLDLDGKNEVIVPVKSGYIYAWQSDGRGYVSESGIFGRVFDSTFSKVAIGDVYGDERLEVVACAANGRVYLFPYSGLSAVRIFNTGDKIRASPVLFDLDNDGKKDIIVGSTDLKLYAWKGTGEPVSGFPVYLGSEVRSSVAIASSREGSKIILLTSDNRLFLINPTGAIEPGFPLSLSTSPLLTYSPPVVGDIDRDGKLEICLIIQGDYDYKLMILDLTGKVKYESREIIRRPCLTAPALADIDSDGFLEVLIASKNRIYAFKYNGTLVTNYPVSVDSLYTVQEIVENWLIISDVEFVYNSSLVVGDVNRDRILDIMIGSPQYGLLGFNSRTGAKLPDFPLMTDGSVSATPLLGDLDNDGDLEVIVGSDDGVLYCWDMEGEPISIVWSEFLKNKENRGEVLASELPEKPEPPEWTLKDFYLYPNPAGKNVTIRYRLGAGESKIRLQIFDVAGDPVSKEFIGTNTPLTDNEVNLDLQGVSSGVYLVRLEVENKGKKEIKFYKLAVKR